jgi:hypothetical protein
MDANCCPMCQKATIIVGSVRTMDGHFAFEFVPGDIRALLFQRGVLVQFRWNACLSCGHVWSSVAPQELRAYIAGRGTELLKQRVDQLNHGPAHDLPDLPKAHQAAEKVAEIDGLILAGKQVEANRRYREFTRSTWDQVVDTMRSWRNLKRPQKLALLGWAPDEKPPAVIPEATGHPMADYWLDALPAQGRSGQNPVEE